MARQLYVASNELVAQARSLDVLSMASQWRALMDSADNLLKGTVNGGAWLPFAFGGGGVVSMQGAYDGVGALGTGLGRSITQMDGGPVVFTNDRANNNGVLEINKTPAGVQTGDALVIAMNVNASVVGVRVDAAAVNATGIQINMAATTTLAGLDVVLLGTSGGISVTKSNNSAGAGEDLLLMQDVAAGASGARNMTLATLSELSTFTASGSFALDPVQILFTPASSGGATILTLNRSIVFINHAPTSAAGGALVDSTVGLRVTMTPVAGSAINGVIVTMNEGAGGAPGSSAIRCDYRSTLGTTQGILDLSPQGAVVLAGAVTAINANLNNYTPGGNAITGISLAVPASTNAGTVGYFVTSAQTQGSVADFRMTGNPGAGGITGLSITLSPGAAGAARGLLVTMGASTSNAGYAGTFDWRSASGTAAGNGIINVDVGAATALTAGGANPITGLELDLNSNLTANDNIVRGGVIQLADSTAADAANTVAAGVLTHGSGALIIHSRQRLGRIVDILAANTGNAGGLVRLRYPSAITLLAPLIGVNVDFTSNVAGNTQQVGCMFLSTPAAGSSASYCATFDYRCTAGTVNNNGIVNIEIGTPTTFAGVLTGIECDLSSNVNAATAVSITGMTARLSANMGNNSSMHLALRRGGTHTINGSTFTGNSISVGNAPQAGAGGIAVTENGILIDIDHTPTVGAGGTIADTTLAIDIAMTPAFVASNVRGINVIMGANTGTGGYAATFDWRGTAGTAASGGIVRVLPGAATLLTGGLTGVLVDLGAGGFITGGQTARCIDCRLPLASGVGSGIFWGTFGGPAGGLWGGAVTGLILLGIEAGAVTLTGPVQGLFFDFNSGITAGIQAVTGARINLPTIGPPTGAHIGLAIGVGGTNNVGTFGIDIDSTQTAGDGINILMIGIPGAAGYDGIDVTCAPGAAGVVRPIFAAVGANASNPSSGITCEWQGTAGTTAGAGVLRALTGNGAGGALLLGAGNTLTSICVHTGTGLTLNAGGGTWTGLWLDMDGVTHNNQVVIGIDIDIPATSNGASFAIDIDSAQTGGRAIDVNMAGTAGGIGVTLGATNTGTGYNLSTTGASSLGLNMSYTGTSVRAGTFNWILHTGTWSGGGIDSFVFFYIDRGPTITASATVSNQSWTLLVRFNPVVSGGATVLSVDENRVMSIQWDPTSAGGGTINYTNGLGIGPIGLEIDMVPPAAGARVRGMQINMGANTGATASYGYAFANASVIQIPALRLGAPSSATGSQVYVGSGVPAHATGVNNGDFYLRTDGGAGTMIYARIGGAWVAIA